MRACTTSCMQRHVRCIACLALANQACLAVLACVLPACKLGSARWDQLGSACWDAGSGVSQQVRKGAGSHGQICAQLLECLLMGKVDNNTGNLGLGQWQQQRYWVCCAAKCRAMMQLHIGHSRYVMWRHP